MMGFARRRAFSETLSSVEYNTVLARGAETSHIFSAPPRIGRYIQRYVHTYNIVRRTLKHPSRFHHIPETPLTPAPPLTLLSPKWPDAAIRSAILPDSFYSGTCAIKAGQSMIRCHDGPIGCVCYSSAIPPLGGSPL